MKIKNNFQVQVGFGSMKFFFVGFWFRVRMQEYSARSRVFDTLANFPLVHYDWLFANRLSELLTSCVRSFSSPGRTSILNREHAQLLLLSWDGDEDKTLLSSIIGGIGLFSGCTSL